MATGTRTLRERPAARWAVIVTALALLAALPALVGAWPASDTAIAAPDLLARVQASGGVAYSGYAEARGGLALPVTSQFSDLADLFGAETQMRVWWRAPKDFRVDTVGLSGERDVVRSQFGLWTWDYESNRAAFNDIDNEAVLRLPRSADLLPPELARRLLSQAQADEVRRIGAARVAGRDAVGLRLVPDEPRSTIGHVDVWADPGTGLALRVAAYGRRGAVVDSMFLDVSTGTPDPARTRFYPPDRAQVFLGHDVLDLAGEVNQLGRAVPPQTLAGLARNDLVDDVGSIGIYGRGVTEVALAALPARVADTLRTPLAKAAQAVSATGTITVAVGPLTIMLGPAQVRGASWLLVGTVAPEALASALSELPDAAVFRR